GVQRGRVRSRGPAVAEGAQLVDAEVVEHDEEDVGRLRRLWWWWTVVATTAGDQQARGRDRAEDEGGTAQVSGAHGPLSPSFLSARAAGGGPAQGRGSLGRDAAWGKGNAAADQRMETLNTLFMV